MEFNVNYDKSSLKIVKTVYSTDEMNEYVKLGHTVIPKLIKPADDLYSQSHLFSNKLTGEYESASSREEFIQYSGVRILPEESWDKVFTVKNYSRKRSLICNWGAYILPLNTVNDEILYIEDLIEDIKVSEFWGAIIYAVDGVARWTGESLELDMSLFDSSECRIVG